MEDSRPSLPLAAALPPRGRGALHATQLLLCVWSTTEPVPFACTCRSPHPPRRRICCRSRSGGATAPQNVPAAAALWPAARSQRIISESSRVDLYTCHYVGPVEMVVDIYGCKHLWQPQPELAAAAAAVVIASLPRLSFRLPTSCKGCRRRTQRGRNPGERASRLHGACDHHRIRRPSSCAGRKAPHGTRT